MPGRAGDGTSIDRSVPPVARAEELTTRPISRLFTPRAHGRRRPRLGRGHGRVHARTRRSPSHPAARRSGSRLGCPAHRCRSHPVSRRAPLLGQAGAGYDIRSSTPENGAPGSGPPPAGSRWRGCACMLGLTRRIVGTGPGRGTGCRSGPRRRPRVPCSGGWRDGRTSPPARRHRRSLPPSSARSSCRAGCSEPDRVPS